MKKNRSGSIGLFLLGPLGNKTNKNQSKILFGKIFVLCLFCLFCAGCQNLQNQSPDGSTDRDAHQEPDLNNDQDAGDDIVDDPDEDPSTRPYVVVDTNLATCYGASGEIDCPASGQAFFGQDAQHQGPQPAYQDNGDGTVTDLKTGLMWQKGYAAQKQHYTDAKNGAASFDLAGYSDWRLPTIKELYSLIQFNGIDPDPMATSDNGLIPFIHEVFDFRYGDTSSQERIIDAQYATTSLYNSTTMGGNATMFGVNFADGRIKGYPRDRAMFEVKYVRGNLDYGKNDFQDNGDSTITDQATGLLWTQADSGTGLLWEQALAWVDEKNRQNHLGYSDWRLPNAKELQSLVDYSRDPDTTGSAAIHPLFQITPITNESGQIDYPQFWSSTTHLSNKGNVSRACYVCFGRCMGYFQNTWQDVHGAGAQRSDPKTGDPQDYPNGLGPQGDAIRIYNYVLMVRDAK